MISSHTQQPVVPAVLYDVLCGLFCFFTEAHEAGWHEAESLKHNIVQLVVPGSQTEFDHLF